MARPRRQVQQSASIALAGVVLIVVAPALWVSLVGLGLIGMGFSTIVPVVFSECGRSVGIRSDTALATVSTIGYFGFLLGPPLIGLLAEQLGLPLALGSLTVTTGAALALAAVISRRVPQPPVSADADNDHGPGDWQRIQSRRVETESSRNSGCVPTESWGRSTSAGATR